MNDSVVFGYSLLATVGRSEEDTCKTRLSDAFGKRRYILPESVWRSQGVVLCYGQ